MTNVINYTNIDSTSKKFEKNDDVQLASRKKFKKLRENMITRVFAKTNFFFVIFNNVELNLMRVLFHIIANFFDEIDQNTLSIILISLITFLHLINIFWFENFNQFRSTILATHNSEITQNFKVLKLKMT